MHLLHYKDAAGIGLFPKLHIPSTINTEKEMLITVKWANKNGGHFRMHFYKKKVEMEKE